MKDSTKVVFWLLAAMHAFMVIWRCGHASGEAAARQRYHDAVKRADACQAAGGNAYACKSRFAPW